MDQNKYIEESIHVESLEDVKIIISEKYTDSETYGTLTLDVRNTTPEEITDILNFLNKEGIEKLPYVICDVNVKECPFESKVATLKHMLGNEDLRSPTGTLNIYNLLKDVNSFSEEYFNCKETYTNSLEEFIDLRTELKEDLDRYAVSLSHLYLSICVNFGVLDGTDPVHKLPSNYKSMFLISDLHTLSRVVKKHLNNIDLKNLKRIDCAPQIFGFWSEKHLLGNHVWDYVLNRLEQKPE